MEWQDIWVPAGIVFAFQIQMVRWRVDREIHVKEELRKTVWMPPCDYLNLVSMMATAAFVFVLPMLLPNEEIHAFQLATIGFGLSAILLIGYLVALLGHYRLFIPTSTDWHGSGTLQEWVAIVFTVALAGAYLIGVWPRVSSVFLSGAE